MFERVKNVFLLFLHLEKIWNNILKCVRIPNRLKDSQMMDYSFFDTLTANLLLDMNM